MTYSIYFNYLITFTVVNDRILKIKRSFYSATMGSLSVSPAKRVKIVLLFFTQDSMIKKLEQQETLKLPRGRTFNLIIII